MNNIIEKVMKTRETINNVDAKINELNLIRDSLMHTVAEQCNSIPYPDLYFSYECFKNIEKAGHINQTLLDDTLSSLKEIMFGDATLEYKQVFHGFNRETLCLHVKEINTDIEIVVISHMMEYDNIENLGFGEISIEYVKDQGYLKEIVHGYTIDDLKTNWDLFYNTMLLNGTLPAFMG